MAIEVNDIQFWYSGSGSTGGSTSLGGVISSTRVGSQLATPTSGITGVTINWALNNAEGNGLLSWSKSTNTIGWKPPGSLNTYLMVLSVNGTFTIGGTDGQLVVTIVFASLPVIYTQDTTSIANQLNKVFDSVSAANSLVGKISYRCLYVKNAHATLTASGVKAFIAQLTTGPDEIEIGLDPAGIGNGSSTGVATTIANETTAPAGVTFSSPTAAISGLQPGAGSLTPGQVFALWEKRTVVPNTTGSITQNSSKIGVALTS